MRRSSLASFVAMAVLIATAGGAGAATTIGQLAPPNPPAFCTLGPFDVVQPTVTSGNSYVVPGDGVLTSWSHNAAAGAGQTLTMKVFRKVADPNTYQVIGHDGPRPLDASALNTFPASIPVKPGDLLGVNDANASDANNASPRPSLSQSGSTEAVALMRVISRARNVKVVRRTVGQIALQFAVQVPGPVMKRQSEIVIHALPRAEGKQCVQSPA